MNAVREGLLAWVGGRSARRQLASTAIVAELESWKDIMREQVEPKSPLGRALGYLHRQWPRLTAFLSDPLMELTNNEVERDLRRWVLDRKTDVRAKLCPARDAHQGDA